MTEIRERDGFLYSVDGKHFPITYEIGERNIKCWTELKPISFDNITGIIYKSVENIGYQRVEDKNEEDKRNSEENNEDEENKGNEGNSKRYPIYIEKFIKEKQRMDEPLIVYNENGSVKYISYISEKILITEIPNYIDIVIKNFKVTFKNETISKNIKILKIIGYSNSDKLWKAKIRKNDTWDKIGVIPYKISPFSAVFFEVFDNDTKKPINPKDLSFSFDIGYIPIEKYGIYSRISTKYENTLGMITTKEGTIHRSFIGKKKYKYEYEIIGEYFKQYEPKEFVIFTDHEYKYREDVVKIRFAKEKGNKENNGENSHQESIENIYNTFPYHVPDIPQNQMVLLTNPLQMEVYTYIKDKDNIINYLKSKSCYTTGISSYKEKVKPTSKTIEGVYKEMKNYINSYISLTS